MANPLAEIERILNEEHDLYTQLYAVEEKKSAAINDKDGRLLEEYCARQEMILSRVSGLEGARLEQIDRYAEMHHLHDQPRTISLRDIVLAMDEDASHRLMSRGIELKKLLLRLESLFQTNSTMIRDNLEFFNLLLSGLRSSVTASSGYCEKGMDKGKRADSLLFNKTV